MLEGVELRRRSSQPKFLKTFVLISDRPDESPAFLFSMECGSLTFYSWLLRKRSACRAVLVKPALAQGVLHHRRPAVELEFFADANFIGLDRLDA